MAHDAFHAHVLIMTTDIFFRPILHHDSKTPSKIMALKHSPTMLYWYKCQKRRKSPPTTSSITRWPNFILTMHLYRKKHREQQHNHDHNIFTEIHEDFENFKKKSLFYELSPMAHSHKLNKDGECNPWNNILHRPRKSNNLHWQK